jgi:predicted GIY-YIG superfamily endonuclease
LPGDGYSPTLRGPQRIHQHREGLREGFTRRYLCKLLAFMQERCNTLAQQMKLIGENAQQGQRSLEQLYASMESNLALAKHAEEWEWKEAAPQKEGEPADAT